MPQPIHVTDAEFQQKVIESPTPVLVDFWATWCAPCKVIAPTLEEIAREQGDKLLVAKINADENPQWVGRFGVMSLPTLLFIKNGREVARHVGAAPAQALKKKVQGFLNS